MRWVFSRIRRLTVACGTSFAAMLSVAQADTAIFSGSGAGSIDFFQTAQTGNQFYGARNFAPFPVNSNGVNFYFHEDTNTGVFSLGIVVDSRGDGTGGRFAGTITGLGSGAFVSFSDDNGEVRMSSPGSGTVVFNYRFASCCTDGAVISGLDRNNLNFAINVTNSTGLTGTYLVGPSGTVSLGGAPGIGSTFAVTSSAPEPQAWALFIMGFAATAIALKRARRIRSQSLVYA